MPRHVTNTSDHIASRQHLITPHNINNIMSTTARRKTGGVGAGTDVGVLETPRQKKIPENIPELHRDSLPKNRQIS